MEHTKGTSVQTSTVATERQPNTLSNPFTPQSFAPLSAASARGSIAFRNVSKAFKRATTSKKSYSTLKSRVLNALLLRPKEQGPVIQALRDFTMDITPGKAVGIIGRNGSGKSTTLKLIAGIYRADAGSVEVNGRLSALIELGAGFHPDFTGRENVYLGGVMFGLSRKEIDAKFDRIVEFAELEDFIDDPVRTYSSGMYMRLGFSLAVHTDPDILLVDEVLAVGDAAFVHRCQERISELKRRGKTLVFVTHDLDSVVRWCDEVIWLDKGVVRERGEPRMVVDAYLGAIEAGEKQALLEENTEVSTTDASSEEHPSHDSIEESGEKQRWGSGEVEIDSVIMRGRDGAEKWLYHEAEPTTIEVSYTIHKPIEELVFGIGILRSDGVVALGTNTHIEDLELAVPDSNASYPIKGSYSFCLPRVSLVEGSYFVDAAVHRLDGTPYDYHHLLHRFSVRNKSRFHGIAALEHHWEIPAQEVAAHTAVNRRS